MRSDLLQPHDTLAAAELLQQCLINPGFTATTLADADAAAAVASAFVSINKRAAVFIRAASAAGHDTALQDEVAGSAGLADAASIDQEGASTPVAAAAARVEARDSEHNVRTAALCFAAAAPALAAFAFNIASRIQQAAGTWHTDSQQQANNPEHGSSSSTTNSDSSSIAGSSSFSCQSKASAVLLAVLLARSLVVLADAMEAAAAAAGCTPAELYAR
jgi:hypothetical protein